MKVLVVHNYYQLPGGEDSVFHTEAALLEQHGHEVFRFTAHNRDVAEHSLPSLAGRTIWNPSSRRDVAAVIRDVRPDVMHVHNTLPLISPSIYGVARSNGAAVVQTLHNYRLICPGALLLRDGRPCEDCVGTVMKVPAVRHRCYRDSQPASLSVATMLGVHRLAGTWQRLVDRYIVLSHFARQKFIEGGLPADRLVVKANCVSPDPGFNNSPHDGYALFVGRLSPEKGLGTLLEAWSRIPNAPLLRIAGDGPMMPAARDGRAGIEWLGHQPREALLDVMKGASILIVPSEWYEGWPLTVVDAFAVGTPVLASRIGALTEMVTDGVTGLLFEPRSPDDLVRTFLLAQRHPAAVAEMARRARREFELRYSAEPTYEALTRIYADAIENRGRDHGVPADRSDRLPGGLESEFDNGASAPSGQRAH